MVVSPILLIYGYFIQEKATQMKNLEFRFPQVLIARWCLMLVGVAVVLSGCVAFATHDDHGKSWSGQTGEALKKVWGQPQGQETLPNGFTEIRYDLQRMNCTYWFTLDEAGKIVDYRYKVGTLGTCKPT